MQKDPPLKTRGRHWRSDVTFLAWIVGNCIGLNLLLHTLVRWMGHSGRFPKFFDDNTLSWFHMYLARDGLTDSWGTMLSAVNFAQAHPAALIYRSVFFVAHVKFQYPLTSLLPFLVLRHFGWDDALIISLSNWVNRISVGLVAYAAIKIAAKSAQPDGRELKRLGLPTTVAIAVGSFLFYPLISGCVVGQIQTELTLFYCIAFYFWLRRFEGSSGVLIGLMILVKPQYTLLFLWGVARKRWRFVRAGLIPIGIVLPITIIRFGWQNNWDYLAVLHALSRVGEVASSNQTMNGLLNRLLFNGDSQWIGGPFPPFNPIVYAGTLASFVALIALALIYPVHIKRAGSIADFACMTAVTTLSSPIAWDNHYGVFLPILIWLWFGRANGHAPLRKAPWLIAAYVLVGDSLSPLNALAYVPVANLALSYMYFGGLIVLWILLSPRYDGASESAPIAAVA